MVPRAFASLTLKLGGGPGEREEEGLYFVACTPCADVPLISRGEPLIYDSVTINSGSAYAALNFLLVFDMKSVPIDVPTLL